MEYVVAAVIGLGGLAYAIRNGRIARRTDLTEEQLAWVRRQRQLSLRMSVVAATFAGILTILMLALGYWLPALLACLACGTGVVTVLYLRRLLAT